MRPSTTVVALLIALSGCPKAVPQNPPAQPLTLDQQLAKEVDSWVAEALTLVQEQDELLWAHWTQGTPLELQKPALGHAVLFDDATLSKIRIARSKNIAAAVPLKKLETWLIGERLARATAEATALLTSQETAAMFHLDGKPLAWRELSRLLANEKSAVKRRALWAASREAIPLLVEGTKKRDEAFASALAGLGATVADCVGLSREDSAALGEKFLDDTEVEWKQLLEHLSNSELGLTVDKVVRADLPRMLRPNAAADASFPKSDQAAKATALLGAIRLYGLPGLTLDLAESAKKNPLPLVVAPGGSADVRVSFRPAGGARDIGVLLGEVGRALALRETAEPRLGNSAVAEASFRLFADLAATPDWLKEQGVSEAAAASTIASFRALKLYAARRAAGNLVAQHKAHTQDEVAKAKTWAEWSTRALAISVPADDLGRWSLERDSLFRGAELIQALQIARQLRQKLKPQWWADPASNEILRAAWREEPAPSSNDAGVSAPLDR